MHHVTDLLQQFERAQTELLPALHALQDSLGCVPPEAIPVLASHFNLSKAEVHGVVSYYHDFTSEPRKPQHLQLCMAEACQACGSRALWEQAKEAGAKQADLDVTPAYCLGLCANAPALRLNKTLHAQVDSGKLTQILEQALQSPTKAKASV